MKIPSFVGPLGSIILLLLTIFGFCFYYCYWKPRRSRKQKGECTRNTSTGSSSSKSRSKKTFQDDDDVYYCYNSSGATAFPTGYCFHGGLPMAAVSCSEQRWQPVKMKYRTPCVAFPEVKECVESSENLCRQLRVDVINERVPTSKSCGYISRQLSTDSRGSRHVCHLQAIQECDEDKQENEECCEVEIKHIQTEELKLLSS